MFDFSILLLQCFCGGEPIRQNRTVSLSKVLNQTHFCMVLRFNFSKICREGLQHSYLLLQSMIEYYTLLGTPPRINAMKKRKNKMGNHQVKRGRVEGRRGRARRCQYDGSASSIIFDDKYKVCFHLSQPIGERTVKKASLNLCRVLLMGTLLIFIVVMINRLSRYSFAQAKANPFQRVATQLQAAGKSLTYYNIRALNDPRLENLPYSIRILLESAVRNCDEFEVTSKDVENILNWEKLASKSIEISFKPARVILQDFTGVPAVVDLAAMRDAVARLGGDPKKINPLCPVDLVIDHSVQVDKARVKDAWRDNEEIEFKRNYERFQFLKWGSTAFDNFTIVPPGSGIVHQVNLEYLARVVLENAKGVVYPDSVVGTDSHTTMINGLGVVGWGVGGIEAEAVMLGQPISMVLPEVIGFRLTGSLRQNITATDLVLQIVNTLRKRGVVGKFVEFYGPGVASLSLADRATIANMAPEYGATMGYFPPDKEALNYLRLTNRSADRMSVIEQTLTNQGLLRDYTASDNIKFTDVLALDLNTVEPCLSGPKRPHDRVPVSQMKKDFNECIPNKAGFKGFGVPADKVNLKHSITYGGEKHELKHGSVVLAAITSCTNTSNPDVMIAAGLVAKKAIGKGLKIKNYIKTSLSPGSGVVTKYLDESGLSKYLDEIGFTTAGYGCMTCIGNSGELLPEIGDAITASDIVACSVLSGNRNFEARVHPLIKANYLASPPLVVAYALAGRIDIDFETEPLGTDAQGKPVFLKDIWPSRNEVSEVVKVNVTPQMFKDVYEKISKGTERWNALKTEPSLQYSWKESSTYIHNPPFFQSTQLELPKLQNINNAYCLCSFGDSITTDHISPAGSIAKNSPAARYLTEKGIEQVDFNTYGARRGNDEVMARGTFANTRIINKLAPKVGPQTTYIPTGEVLDISDAAFRYQKEGHPLIILAGQEYGSGSSRDWAAKGPYLQGIKSVIAQSFERIHRSNLAGLGILPLEFLPGQSADSLGLTGKQTFNIDTREGNLKVHEKLKITTNTGKSFEVKVRLDTDVEIEYFKNGGILHYVLRKLAKS